MPERHLAVLYANDLVAQDLPSDERRARLHVLNGRRHTCRLHPIRAERRPLACMSDSKGSLMTSPILLYVDSGYCSPYAMSAFVALTEKQLHFESRPVDLAAGEHQQTRYADMSLTRRVPMLIHGSFALSESSAITEYIDETFSGGFQLYPTQRADRARARQIQAWLRSDFMAIRTERSSTVVFHGPVDAPLSAQARASADKLFHSVSQLITEPNQNVARQWSLADVDLAMMLNRLLLNGDPVPPVLAAYARRQWERPSVQRWVALSRSALLAA
jgi:glutathione S-transferase